MNTPLKKRLTNTWLHPRYLATLYMRLAIADMSPRMSGTVLDVGCGRRQYEDLFRATASRYWGVDSPASQAAAEPHIIGDALQIPIRSASVDNVLATELIEHLPNPDRFLADVSRVLRHGGYLLLSAPLFEPLHEEPRDYFRFTLHGLRALLASHGFVEVSTSRKGGWWSVVLGSLVCQALYETASPLRGDGTRGRWLLGVLVLPLCALLQFAAYLGDRVAPGARCTLGYVVLARKE